MVVLELAKDAANVLVQVKEGVEAVGMGPVVGENEVGLHALFGSDDGADFSW